MKCINIDFNARTDNDWIRLDTAGARTSLAAANIGPQDTWVWLTDGELRVPARLVDLDVQPVARPLWEAIEDLPAAEVLGADAETQQALWQLREMQRTQNWNYRRLFRILPIIERLLPDSGHPLYLRSRAFQALGYPELALAVIEEALQREPQQMVYQHHRFWLLREVNLDRALDEALRLKDRTDLPALLIEACAQTLFADANRRTEPLMHERLLLLLTITDHVDQAPGFETLPASVNASIHVMRGFTLSHLGKPTPAAEEFTHAIQAAPEMAAAWAARGLETYPSPGAVQDMHRAIDLGLLSFWLFYYLAHDAIRRHLYKEALEFAEQALRLQPPPRIEANLLEWLAIAQVEAFGALDEAREKLGRALELAPDLVHLRQNRDAIDRLAVQSERVTWAVACDAEARSVALAA